MTNGAALLERLHVGHRNYQQEMRMIYELRKIECSWTNSQDVGRLATSFLPSNRHASQVQLRTIVSSLFRRGKNRKQIRIPVRETTTAVRFAVHRPTGGEFFFLQRPASFVQSGNYTIIADVRPNVPSIKGLSTSQWTVRGREAAIPLMAQNVYFHSDASGMLGDENGTWDCVVFFHFFRTEANPLWCLLGRVTVTQITNSK